MKIFGILIALLLTFSTSVSFAYKNCNYTLGSISSPDGKVAIMNRLDESIEKTLSQKGYSLSSVYNSDLIFTVRSKALYQGLTLGSIATVFFTDVITNEKMYLANGNFSLAPQIDVLSAVKKLPICK